MANLSNLFHASKSVALSHDVTFIAFSVVFQIIHKKAFVLGETPAWESVSSYNGSIDWLIHLKTIVSKILQRAFAVRKPRDIDSVSDIEVVGLDIMLATWQFWILDSGWTEVVTEILKVLVTDGFWENIQYVIRHMLVSFCLPIQTSKCAVRDYFSCLFKYKGNSLVKVFRSSYRPSESFFKILFQ